MKQKTLCLAVVSMLTIALGAAWGLPATLPFGDGFEDGEHDDTLESPWVIPTGEAKVKSSPETPPKGDKYGYVSDEVELDVNDEAYAYSNVMWTTYAKPTLQSDGAGAGIEIGDSVAAFFVTQSGYVKAYSNTTWVQIGTITSPSDWHKFGVNLDYSTGTYDVYAGATGDDALVKLNNAPLAFQNGTGQDTNFVSFTISGTTPFDDVALSETTFTVGTGESSSPTNIANTSEQIYLREGPGVPLVRYFAPADRGMDGPLGDALFGSLLENDMIHLRLASSNRWYTLTRGSTASGEWSISPLGPALSEFVLDPTSGMVVKFGGGGTRQPAYVSGFNQTYPATTRTFASQSFHIAAIPRDADNNLSVAGGSSALLPSPLVGDIIYLHRTGTSRYYFFRCLEDGIWVDLSNNPVNLTLEAGQAFWFFRNGAELEWNVGSQAYK